MKILKKGTLALSLSHLCDISKKIFKNMTPADAPRVGISEKIFETLRDLHLYSNRAWPSSQGEFYIDLEKLDIVQFLLFLVNWCPGGVISAECNFFCPVAFFCGHYQYIFHISPSFWSFSAPYFGLILGISPHLP